MRRLLAVMAFLALPGAVGATNNEMSCLVSAIHYEARTEALRGKRAVYDVIMHRVKAYRKSICQVVKMRHQFSWVGKKPFKAYNTEMKEMLIEVKSQPQVLNNENFQWFYRKELKPKWSRRMQCRTIGLHKFCKI
jgi:N-acetylmuramoyl-L-alanine amidase